MDVHAQYTMVRPNTQPFSLFWNAERQPGTVAGSPITTDSGVGASALMGLETALSRQPRPSSVMVNLARQLTERRALTRCASPSDLPEYLGYPFLDISSQDPFAILRSPYQMIFGFVDCMASTLYRHAHSLRHDFIRSNFAILADSSPDTVRGILRLLVTNRLT